MPRLLFVLLLLVLPSCSTIKFYAGGIAGQLEILRQQQPVAAVIKDPQTSDTLRQRLILTQQLRLFASETLGLPAANVYDHYRDLHRPHVTWVAFAAPEFSTEPKKWFYPVVGKLEYRGFFNEPDAKQFVSELKRQGMDTAMGGVDAYSTLGYFRDPLLNTFIMDPEAELAELLFHELTHRKLFLPGDTEFNEAFATATGQAGARRWLRSQGKLKALATYEKALEQQAVFTNEVLRTRTQLKKLYASKQSESSMREAKQRLMTSLKNRIKSMPELASQKGFSNWVTKPINNARINAISAYEMLSPAFTHLLETECKGDFPKFFAQVQTMKSLTKAERRARLKAF
jgi:predicted aminopeptidase